jgi:hypothetical protein
LRLSAYPAGIEEKNFSLSGVEQQNAEKLFIVLRDQASDPRDQASEQYRVLFTP